MSIRWMAVQYTGNVLKLPIVNEGDMDRPIGTSRLEREVAKIRITDHEGNARTFVPEQTCHMSLERDTHDRMTLTCDECGEYIPRDEIESKTGYISVWYFCPNCGARVVDE